MRRLVLSAICCVLLSATLAGCAGCGQDNSAENNTNNGSTNNQTGSFTEPVGEWTAEVCDSGADDDGDAFADCADPDCFTAESCAFDADVAAPSLAPNGILSFWDRSRWIFEEGGVQRGVVPGSITEANIGTVRGRVLDAAGEPLAGAAVTFAGHPDLGRSYTREDGTYDLAFAAGRRLVVRVSAAGHITNDRQILGRMHHATALDDVRLIPVEPEATRVDFSETIYAVGTEVDDKDGPRTTAVIVPRGVRARLEFPNGATRPLDVMHLRATEVTVGDGGPEAMMAELPPGTQYTYAAEFTVDEAVEEHAETVRFDRPVFVYVDNFLGLAPGTAAPVGAYDRTELAWQATPDGMVVEVADVRDGRAVLADHNGPLAESRFEDLGLTGDELALVAEHYEVGDTLWRVPARHFSTKDINWGGLFSADSAPAEASDDKPNQCTAGQETGSMIGCSDQTLAERIPLNGTPFTLTYQSGRTSGRKAVLTIPVYPFAADLDKLFAAGVKITVAGQVIADEVYRDITEIPIAADYIWDGLDQFGRPVQGAVDAEIEVSVVFLGRYQTRFTTPRFEGEIPPAPDFGQLPIGDGVTAEVSGRYGWILRRNYTRTLRAGTYDVAQEGLGGWTIDAQHRYDPNGRVMYYGNGQDLPAGNDNGLLRRIGGGGEMFASGAEPFPDGTLATETDGTVGGTLRTPIANDGTIFFADRVNTVRTIDPVTNELGTAAGVPQIIGGDVVYDDFPDDGVRADEARFQRFDDLRIGKDQRLYMLSQGFVYRLESDGTLSRLLGQEGEMKARFPGDREVIGAIGIDDLYDGAPAEDVMVPWDEIDATADGTVFMRINRMIYKRTPDGLVREVAPLNGEACTDAPCGDGEQARVTQLESLQAMAVSAAGDVYFAERTPTESPIRTSFIRKVRADGTLETLGEVPQVSFLELGPGDEVLFSARNQASPEDPAPTYGAGVLQLTPEGEVVPRVGVLRESGESVPNLFGYPDVEVFDRDSADRPMLGGMAFSINASGQLIVSQPLKLFRVDQLFPTSTGTNFQIPQPNGALVDEFDPSGRHIRSVDGLTGAAVWTFEYDDAGRLLSATDVDGDVTRIERAADGSPTAIIGPNGVTWALTVGESGMMTEIDSPEGDVWQFSYDDGLMMSMTNPRDETWEFAYDAAGRLIEDRQPNGSASTLERNPAANDVLFTTPEGRQTNYGSTPPVQAQRSSSVETGDLFVRTFQQHDGWTRTWTNDGTYHWSRSKPHPVYGLIASYTSESYLETPAGLRVDGSSTQSGEANGGDLFGGLNAWQSESTLGESTTTRRWDPGTRALTVTSGEGRTASTTIGPDARPAVVSIAGVEPVSYVYDDQGRLDTVMQSARTVSMAYDDNGYLAAVTSDDGTTTLSRDAMGRVESALRPDNASISFGWDPIGNLTGLTAPGKTMAYEMTNDVRGNQLTMTTPGGFETTYAYDRDYRFVGMVDPVGRSTSVEYDASNRVDQVDLDGESIDYQYADNGQLAAVVGGDVDLDYAWDGPLPTSLTHTGVASGNVSWAWEDGTLNLLFTNINGTAIAHDFDTDGMPTVIGEETLTYRSGTTFLSERSVDAASTTYAYNDYGELAEMVSTVSGTELLRRAFAYDGLGRIIEVVETTADGTTTFAYEYDLIGQLVGVEASGAQTHSHSYTYDANGNRTAVTGGIDTLTAADIDHDADDRLLAYGGVTLDYDDAGRLSRRSEGVGQTTFDYGVSGELREVGLPTGATVSYEHDALRRRVARKVDGTYTHRWLYSDRLNPVAEVDANGETVSTFVYGTGINVPDYMERDQTTYYYVRDHLGSVRFVVNSATGTVAQELRYDAFGNVTLDTNPGFQPFGYAGGLYDHQTGLVRFGARDYDARTGRWTAPDPIGFGGGQANLYVYVANGPSFLQDPTGLVVPIWAVLLIPAIVGAVGNAYFHHRSGGCQVARAALTGFAGGLIAGAVAALLFAPSAVLGPAVAGTSLGAGTTKALNLHLGLDEVENSFAQDVGEAALIAGLVAGGVGVGVAGAGYAGIPLVTTSELGLSGVGILVTESVALPTAVGVDYTFSALGNAR